MGGRGGGGSVWIEVNLIRNYQLHTHLMHNARTRWNNEHVLECVSSPLEKLEPLLVALELHLLIPLQSIGAAYDSTHK